MAHHEDHRTKCRYCGRPFTPWSRTAGFCGGTCGALHRIRRLEGPEQAERARKRWSKTSPLEGKEIPV
jgi:hypothetical protein